VADSETGTSKRGTDQRGTGTTSRGIEDRSLDDRVAIPLTTTSMVTGVLPSQAAKSPNAAPAKKHISPANIWAYRVGWFLPNPANGWTHVFKIRGFKDLLTQLEETQLQGKVSKLVIIAHGDAAGLVQLNQNMTPENVALFGDDFNRLAMFLSTDGMLIFQSCQAGLGDKGSLLLKKISSYLQPNQYAIGFMVNGLSPSIGPGLAGDVFEAPGSMPGMPLREFKNSKRMNEDSVYAKWAQDGYIVRLPIPEEFSNLKGSWEVIMAIANAKIASRFKSVTLKISNDLIELADDSKVIWSGTYKIDFTYRTEVAKKPRTIDINYTVGEYKSKTALGILSFGRADFNSLTICLAEPSKERPDDFTSPANSRRLLLELKRRTAL